MRRGQKFILVTTIMSLFSLIIFPFNNSVLAATSSVNESFQVSPDAKYQDIRESYSFGKEAFRVLSMDYRSPYTQVRVGVPDPLNKLLPTSSWANRQSQPGQAVVGAVNASFFNFSSRLPVSLIAENNQIINYGVITSKTDSPMNKAVAFGMTQAGVPLIDYYQGDVSFQFNGNSIPMYSMNTIRSADSAILFTPSNISPTTNTNEWGTEIVVENASKYPATFGYGDNISGTVTSITKPGTGGNAIIPENGFVISVNGTSLNSQVAGINIGDTVNISATIDSKWQNSQFILGGGPLLVKDGSVSLSMSESSSFVRERTARTAVAVDYDTNKIFLVTVDKKSTDYSVGMNLVEFAQYLIRLGADAAMNLDGGGSTTMAVRKPGDLKLSLINQPKEGTERYISSILEFVNTAPPGSQSYLGVKSQGINLSINEVTPLPATYVLDEFYNPVTMDQSMVSWKVVGDIGEIQNGQFIAAMKAGEGALVVTYNGLTKSVPVVITQRFSDLTPNHWAYNSILYLADRQIVSGYPSGEFKPDNQISRLDAVTMLVKEMGLSSSNPTDPGYVDVNKDTYGYGTIAVASSANIIGGYSDGTFRPSGTLTRAEMASLLTKAYSLSEGTTVPPFTDISSDHWAYKAVKSIYNNNITDGYPDMTYKPGEPITRAEFSAMLHKYLLHKN